MALIDHIRRCNKWTRADYQPFLIGGEALGAVRDDVAKKLRDFPKLFVHGAAHVGLSDRWGSPEDRTKAFREAALRLSEDGLVEKLRGEDYRVVGWWGDEPVMLMDRAMVPLFGIRAFGIHVNGIVRSGEGPRLWIGKRAMDKSVEPGKLDNMVAGGQPAGLTLGDNLIKEAAEEAGLDAGLARQARAVGAITYCMAEGRGLKRDTLFLYDLDMPDAVIPQAVDGEMEHFTLMGWEEILGLLRKGYAFKFNVALVLIDFLIRNGLITPDTEPDYLDLIAGLHGDHGI